MSDLIGIEHVAHTKKVILAVMLFVLGGCAKGFEHEDMATAHKDNASSKMVLGYYDACLKRYSGEPAKAAFNCSSLYGLAAYSRGDFVLAYKTFAPLAMQSQPSAQHYLGLMYLNGYGVSKDEKLAAQLQMQAAKQGDVGAMGTLSLLYEEGTGVTKDNSEAMRWREEAAHLGSSMEYYSLGHAYKAGKITKRNPVLAYMWLTLAAGTSDSELRFISEMSLDELRKEMSDSQISQALRLAREWKPGKPITTP